MKDNLQSLNRLTIAEVRLDELLACFLGGKSKNTIQAYKNDLREFQKFIGAEELKLAAARLISLTGGEANGLILRYRNYLVESGHQNSTVNRRLAAIRSIVELARILGICSWRIEIANLKVDPYRDTRGPGLGNFTKMLALAESQSPQKAKRDIAILRLLFDLALRASELTKINIEDFDGNAQVVAVSAKGKSHKVILSVPKESCRAILEWIEIRGKQPGPLFCNVDRARKGGRLTRNGLYRLIRKLGADIGVITRPHGLRHLSITEACKLAQANGFGLEEVLDHSRHASVATLMIYRDRERNVQGQIASLISNKLERIRK